MHYNHDVHKDLFRETCSIDLPVWKEPSSERADASRDAIVRFVPSSTLDNVVQPTEQCHAEQKTS